MNLGLRDGTFLITGGTAGLGLGLAQTLATEGARVAICGRDPERLVAATAQLEQSGGEVLAMQTDVTELDQLTDAFAQIGAKWGVLDGIVNNAGIATGGMFADVDDATWGFDFDLKLRAITRTVRLGIPLLEKSSRSASVLNVLSVYARFQPAGSMPSSVFRAGGLALTKGLSHELGPAGIRVNAALIGFVHSDQWVRGAEAANQSIAEFEAGRAAKMRIPLGRAGTTEEFADVAAFLLSERASYLTGTALNIDGGLSAVI